MRTRDRRTFLFLILSFGVAHPWADLAAQEARVVARRGFGATVLLLMSDREGQPLSQGSGFFVRRGLIATNLHVISGAAGGQAKLVGKSSELPIKGLVAVDRRYDLVLLVVSDSLTAPLALGDDRLLEIGDVVYAVGNPQGLEGTFSEGIISGVRQLGTDTLIQLTAPISPGSSGGPVLTSKGEVVGIAVGTLRGGQNLNFMIPARYLKQLLSRAGPTRPFAVDDQARGDSSFVSELGGAVREGVSATLVDWVPKTGFGCYSFSLRNRLAEPVSNIRYAMLYWTDSDEPVDYVVQDFREPIAPGLARRISFCTSDQVGRVAARLEFRILDFRFVAPAPRR